MIIQCKNCNFGTRTRAEGLCLRTENIRYCMNCGYKFSDAGLNVKELLSASDKQRNYYQKIFSFYVLGGIFLAMVLGIVLLTLYPNLSNQYYGLTFTAIVASLIPYVFLTARLANKKAENKFPIPSN